MLKNFQIQSNDIKLTIKEKNRIQIKHSKINRDEKPTKNGWSRDFADSIEENEIEYKHNDKYEILFLEKWLQSKLLIQNSDIKNKMCSTFSIDLDSVNL